MHASSVRPSTEALFNSSADSPAHSTDALAKCTHCHSSPPPPNSGPAARTKVGLLRQTPVQIHMLLLRPQFSKPPAEQACNGLVYLVYSCWLSWKVATSRVMGAPPFSCVSSTSAGFRLGPDAQPALLLGTRVRSCPDECRLGRGSGFLLQPCMGSRSQICSPCGSSSACHAAAWAVWEGPGGSHGQQIPAAGCAQSSPGAAGMRLPGTEKSKNQPRLMCELDPESACPIF